MSDVVEQLQRQEEELRLRRAALVERVFAIDEQLERIDAAANALRGKQNGRRPKDQVRSRAQRNSPVSGTPQQRSARSDTLILDALKEHGELPQNRLPELTGLGMGTIHDAKKRLLERDLIEVYTPRKRPPDQGAGRISPRLRLK